VTEHSQFRLLTERRFGPFFATQLAGAFNDSLLKQVLILLVTFHTVEYSSLSAGLVTNLAAGLFILPFVLFSAIAGQLADRYDKARVIRCVKMVEVGIMLVACTGFYFRNLPLLLACVFAMGCHSAFFGPVKYSLLPRVLHKEELTGGNGLLEMGTFLSILCGTLVAGILVATTTNPFILSSALTVVAIIGLTSSCFIPPTGEAAPDLKISYNFFVETGATLKLGRKEGVGVWNSLLAISWFWFIGAVVLSQIPALGKDILKGDASVITTLLTVFSIGIAIGSLVCERLSGHKVEIGLVPIGSIGLTLFTADLALSANHFSALAALADTTALHWNQFLVAEGSLRVLFDITLVGLFGGLFIVPLYAFVQLRTAPERQSRIISANNILNALFMVIAAAMSAVLLSAGMSVTGLILVCAGLNALAAAYIFRTVPEFLMRFLIWVLIHSFYRLKKQGAEIPDTGAAILVCNHVSYVDAMVIAAASPRPMRFVIDNRIYQTPILNFIFRTGKAIPITSGKDDPQILEEAYDRIAAALANGDLICIFPEGGLTDDGEIGTFKPGIARIVERTPAPVIPLAVQGLWGSFFSRKGGAAMRKWPRGIFSAIGLNVGKAIPAGNVTPEVLRTQVMSLRGLWK
jgi:1-acyl-sn-glycerol-3-phosphate acyltransferase